MSTTIPAKVPYLKGITEDTLLDRRKLSACFDTQYHADRAWQAYQTLVELVSYVHGADAVPEPLDVLREIDIHELGRGVDGLTIGDVIRLADMAELTQVVAPVHVELAGVIWEKADQDAIICLRNALYTNLPE